METVLLRQSVKVQRHQGVYVLLTIPRNLAQIAKIEAGDIVNMSVLEDKSLKIEKVENGTLESYI